MKTKQWTHSAYLAALAILLAAITAPDDASAGLKLCDRDWASPADMLKQLSETEKIKELHRDKYYVAYQDPNSTTMWTFTLPNIPSHPAVVCRQPIKEAEMMRLHMDVNCDGDERACDALVKDFQRLNSDVAREMNKPR